VIARLKAVELNQKPAAGVSRHNEELAGFTILAGIEVDILADGRLDISRYSPDSTLVIASDHSGFARMREMMAPSRPHASPLVVILGHPTGRSWAGAALRADVNRINRAAATPGNFLEINPPRRLAPE
jgi:DNA polymerase (family 10)